MQNFPKQYLRVSSLFLFFFFLANNGYAGGYSVVEHSTNSVATAGAYLASSHGADTSFVNPANMVWEKDNKSKIELDLSLVRLPKTKFEGTVNGTSANAYSEEENLPYPNFHYVSPAVNDYRFGFSLAPATFGLTKRWSTPLQAISAEKFALEVIEMNPVFGYEINDKFSIGGGLRFIYGSAIVKSDGIPVSGPLLGVGRITRNMQGTAFNYGYNLALSVKPVEDVNLAITYRSKVDLMFEGNVELTTLGTFSGKAKVSVPLPAILNIGASYTFCGNTTVDFTFERMFWSTYKELDFSYSSALPNATMTAVFDAPVSKVWKDTNAFRFGVTHQWNSDLTLMVGYAYENNPIPNRTVGFELPDSNSHILAVGAKYQVTKKSKLGFSVLCNQFVSRRVHDNNSGINGTFQSTAQLFNLSYEYEF